MSVIGKTMMTVMIILINDSIKKAGNEEKVVSSLLET
jgi:hypothetical protein